MTHRLLISATLTLALSVPNLVVAAQASASPSLSPDVFSATRVDATSPTTVTGNVLLNDAGDGLTLTGVTVTGAALANSCFQTTILQVDAPEVSWDSSGSVTVDFLEQWPSGLPTICMARAVYATYTAQDSAGGTSTGRVVLVEDMPSGGHSNPRLVATEDSVMVRTTGRVKLDVLANDVLVEGTEVVGAGVSPLTTQMTADFADGVMSLDNTAMTSAGSAYAAYLLRSPQGELAFGSIRLDYQPPTPMGWSSASILNLCSSCTAPIFSDVRSRFRIAGIRVVPGTTVQFNPLLPDSFAHAQSDASLFWSGDNAVQPNVGMPAIDWTGGPVQCPGGVVWQRVMLDVDVESISGEYLPRTYRIAYETEAEARPHVCRRGTVPADQTLLPTSAPEMKGQGRVGRRVRVGASTWPVKTSSTYRWHVGGAKVRGDRGSRPSLLLTPSMKGKRIMVRVTVKASGYQPFTRALRLPGRVR